MSLGILFSGQGSQFTGMGLDLYQKSPVFKKVIDDVSEISKLDIYEVLGDENKINETIYLQPALVAMSLGIYEILAQNDRFVPKGAVGLSLGEYSALMSSGMLDKIKGFKILTKRAQYMQEDAKKIQGSMAALLSPKVEEIESLCKKISTKERPLSIANYNSPKQIVIGGEKEAVLEAILEIESKKFAKKAVELHVSGAFHTLLFKNAGERLQQELKNVSFSIGDYPVLSNTLARPFSDNDVEVLSAQVYCPTYFSKCVIDLIKKQGIDSFVEIGPGKTLSKFVRQIDRKVPCSHIDNFETCEEFLENLTR